MQNNPNTDNTEDTDDTDDQVRELDLDCRDWKNAFEPLEGTGYPVIRMGFNIRTLRRYLDAQIIKPRPVIEALDEAMEVLFPFTEFHKASFDLFLKYSDGQLTSEEEQMLNAMGVKT